MKTATADVTQVFGPPTIEAPPSPSRAPWILALLAMCCAGGVGFVAFGLQSRRELLENELQKVAARAAGAEAQAEALNKRLEGSQSKVDDLAARLESADSDRAQLALAMDELSKNVASKNEELIRLKATESELRDKLKAELSSGDVSLTEDGGKLRVGLVDKVLFNSGEATINKLGENVLMRVGTILAGVADRQILVSGHTDQTPIGEKRAGQFATNWELSVARATNVVRFLQDKASVPGDRLVASGFGEFHPVASNKAAAGRARNRRIEILLVPAMAPMAIGKTKLAERTHKKAK